MLSLQNLKKEYGQHLILNVPDLKFKTGLYWVKGANGSGKSTLLKIIAGMIPFEGEVEINAINLRKQPTEYRRLVNYVEAEPLYPAYLTGLDLISFFSATRQAHKSAFDNLVEKFGIQGFIKNPVGTYSSGMVKKLSLVLAFIGEPNYILLDEPLVTIDKDSIPILYDLIQEYSAKGVSFIFTSHQAFDRAGIAMQTMEVKDQRVWPL